MQDQKKRPEFDIYQFEIEIYEHKWSFAMKFDDTSFYSYRQAVDKEKHLFDKAMRNGIDAVLVYKNAQNTALMSLVQAQTDMAVKHTREYYTNLREREFPTGDEEFDKFRMMVINFDSTYDYSDDIRAYRAGKAQENAIKEVLNNATSPKYYEFYQYYTAKHK